MVAGGRPNRHRHQGQSGVVALTGYVPSFAAKYRAELAAKQVSGVTAVANDLAVRLPGGGVSTDPQIARAALAALERELPRAGQNVKPIVREGHVVLEGTVEWHYEREAAERAVRHVPGVLSVGNSIAIKPRIAPTEIKRKIEEAFRRNAGIDAQQIAVEASGSEVTLRGRVRSWAERDQAELSAWSAPGISMVRNDIVVQT